MAKAGDDEKGRFCGSATSQLKAATASGRLAWQSGATSRLPIEKSDFLDAVWYHDAKDATFVAYEASDGEAVYAGVCRLAPENGKLAWCSAFRAFNLVAAVGQSGDLYLAGIGTIGRVDRLTGKYRWKIQNLYAPHPELNIFRVPVEDGDVVMFYGSPYGTASEIKRVAIQRETGRVLAIKSAAAFPADATDHSRTVPGCE